MRRAVLVLAAVATACGGLGPQERELELSRDLWKRVRPTAYAYAIERQCFCAQDAIGPVRVTVDGDVVIARVYTMSGLDVPAELAGLFPDVDGLFDLLSEAIDQGAHEVRVTYDAGNGVPIDFWIDYLEFAVDEELGMQVTQGVSALGSG